MDQGLEGHIPLSALRPMYRALAAVNAAVGLDETLQAIADGVASCTPFEHIVVNVVQADGDLRATVVVGPPEVRDALLGVVNERTAMDQMVKGARAWGNLRFLDSMDEGAEGVNVFIPEMDVDEADPQAWRPEYGLLAPMYDAHGEMIGLLSMDVPVDGRIPPFWVVEVLEAFTEQAAIAIVNANRHEVATARMQRLEREREALRKDIAKRQQHEADLRHQARHDALTGLANSAELRERLADLVAEGVPLAVYFCDLDLFKKINDSYGHAIGDLVLRHVADRLRNAVRGGDIVARLGGDEFVVVAVDVGRAEAYALLDRLDQAFAHPVTVDGHPPQLVGASLGIAYAAAIEHSELVAKERAEELLSAADSKMYARKRSRAAISRLTAQAWPNREAQAQSAEGRSRSADAAGPGPGGMGPVGMGPGGIGPGGIGPVGMVPGAVDGKPRSGDVGGASPGVADGAPRSGDAGGITPGVVGGAPRSGDVGGAGPGGVGSAPRSADVGGITPGAVDGPPGSGDVGEITPSAADGPPRSGGVGRASPGPVAGAPPSDGVDRQDPELGDEGRASA